MDTKFIAGKSIDQWQTSHPLIPTIMAAKETFWANPSLFPVATELPGLDISSEHVRDAADRLNRFAPYIAAVFPETRSAEGIIESPLRPVPAMQQALAARHDISLPGRLLIKCDSHLPISGSIKARGGIYEVLKHAETLALEHKMLSVSDDYACLAEARFTEFFSNYSIAVGSTGNLGLSIGIMGARLGFRVTVHMSADARAWKKEMLHSKGVQVIEYADDYGKAVAEGRRQAAADPKCHFVDDENSRDLFIGYAVAGERLKRQLAEMKIPVDADHPLFVYLPCGVGGGPGGVAFGLKLAFGDAVHCFFAEPTRSPAMLLGLYTGLHDKVSVRDFGLDNITAADGLAVGRPSGFVGKRMQHLMDGAFTVSDESLFRYLALLADSEELYMEPSALAGMGGMVRLMQDDAYLENLGLKRKREQATHIAWGTGGSMVPGEEMESYYRKGRELLKAK